MQYLILKFLKYLQESHNEIGNKYLVLGKKTKLNSMGHGAESSN